MTMGGTQRGHERWAECGSATVWVAAVCVLIVVALAAGLGIGRGYADRGVARAAADIAALQGADVLVNDHLGVQAACTRAEASALANEARVESCEADRERLTITVSVDSLLGIRIRADATAGPVEE